MSNKQALRLKISFEKDDKVERTVDIQPDSSLEDLHLTIMAAFELSPGEMASFWLIDGDNNWDRTQEVPMIRMEQGDGEESASMRDVEIAAATNADRPRLIYEYDMLLMWVFKIEFEKMSDMVEHMEYPVLISDKGKLPNTDQARAEMLNSTDMNQLNSGNLFEDGGGSEDHEDYDSLEGGDFEDY